VREEGKRGVCRSYEHGSVLLHSSSGYEYYKVPVRHGETLVEGKVWETCVRVGLQAVCAGPSGCQWNDVSKCLVTPLSLLCDYAMKPIKNILCPNLLENQCGPMLGLFNYMNNWQQGGECGILSSSKVSGSGVACSQGKHFMSTVSNQYFAYCVKKVEPWR